MVFLHTLDWKHADVLVRPRLGHALDRPRPTTDAVMVASLLRMTAVTMTASKWYCSVQDRCCTQNNNDMGRRPWVWQQWAPLK